MPLFAESQEKIYGDIMFDMVNNTVISRSSPGAKMRALVEAVSLKMGSMYSQFDLNFVQAFLDGAEGRFLNFIGDMMNVPRLGEEPARVTAADQNIRFFVDVGTFGDINGGSSILLTGGTIVSTGSGGSGIRYRVTVDTILAASLSEAYVSVEAVRSGSSPNVAAKQLIYHDFNNYTDSSSDTLLVENTADIVNGQDIEIDSNYRFRIANQVVAAEGANPTAIRLAALAVPGVADITMVPYHRGIGSYELLVKSTTPTIPTGLVQTVRSAVARVGAQGIVSYVRGPTELGMSLVATVSFRRRLSSEEESSILVAATNNITDYVNNLDISEDFVVNEVVERVLSTSDLIKNIGQANQPLDSIYIYRPSRLEDNKVRSTLIGDFSPEVDEKLLVEPSNAGSVPILVRSTT